MEHIADCETFDPIVRAVRKAAALLQGLLLQPTEQRAPPPPAPNEDGLDIPACLRGTP